MSAQTSQIASAKHGRRGARARHGFTLVEIMVAGAVFAIGILGVTYLQSVSIHSNQDAYESMVATHYARVWIERIKRDALGWTQAGAPVASAMFPTRPGAAPPTYFVPGALPVGNTGLWPLDASESTGINYHGFEVGQVDLMTNQVVTNADIYYCATGQFLWASNSGGQLGGMTAVVTVWWNPFRGVGQVRGAGGPTLVNNYMQILVARQGGCDAVTLPFNPFAEPFPAGVRRVRLSTAVRWTPPS